MAKRLLSLLLACCLALTLVPETVNAAEIVSSGYCGGEGDGTNLSWTLDSEGTLTISGTGKMKDYPTFGWSFDYSYSGGAGPTPWTYYTGRVGYGSADPRDYTSRVKKAVIADGVTTIGEGAFQLCKNLREVSIASTVTEISDRAFEWCESLEQITLPDGLLKCGSGSSSYVFRNCKRLKDIIIPESVTMLGGGLFLECTSLEEVNIPRNVNLIGGGWSQHRNDGLVPGCSALKTINVSPDNQYYSSLDGVLYNKEQTWILDCPEGYEGKLRIPEGVTTAAWGAFYDCARVTEIFFPSTLVTIQSSYELNTFYGCKSLTAFSVDSMNSVFSTENGVLFYQSYGKRYLFSFPKTYVGAYDIPNNIDGIWSYAFSYCPELTAVHLPSEMFRIYLGAFRGCSKLETITIPDGITLIDSWLLEDCSSLKSIYIPSSVNVNVNEFLSHTPANF